MIELQVIKTLLNKNTWVAYRKFVNKKQLTKELLTLLEILDTYHSKHDVDLSVSDFEVV